MKIKNIIVGILIILIIPAIYLYIEAFESKIVPLQKSSYKLKTYNIDNNIAASFNDLSDGKFHVHSGVTKAAKGVFTFQDKMDIEFKFSIRNESKVGDIEFTVKKNENEIDRFVCTAKEKNVKNVNLHVDDGDQVEILVDKHGTTDYDWGRFFVTQTEVLFSLNNFIIPFLWIMLFVYMLGKGFKYLSINMYIIFILYIFSEKVNFGKMPFESILTYTLLLFAMTFIFAFIYQELRRIKKFRIVSIFSFISVTIVYMLPLSALLYALNFNTGITKSVIFDVFQSNTSEAYEFLVNFMQIKYFFLFILITSLIAFLLFRQEKKETSHIEKSLMIFLIITFLSIVITQFKSLKLPSFALAGFEKYSKQIADTKRIQAQRKAGIIKFDAEKREQNETYIVVIGESLNKKHMGLYGYLRDTTPILSKMQKNDDLLVFDEVHSSHVKTMHTLKIALTEANQYNKKQFDDSLSIIEILNKADVETYWLTNQPLYGPMDNIVTVLAKSADHFISGNARSTYDDHLVDKLKTVLAEKSEKSKVIFVHLMGNHFMYTERYPEEYNIYNKSLSPGEFGKEASQNDRINSYDNSIVYNDYIVSTMINELKRENGVTGLIYFSDHGEDVIGENGQMIGHHSVFFTFDMIQIPMLAWFSKEYKGQYQNKYKVMLETKKTLFTNDLLYDTMIGMFNIKTDYYNPKYDLTSKKYSLKDEEAWTMHTKKALQDQDNYIYWQKINAKYIQEHDLSKKIVVSDVNSIGKLVDIWKSGLRSLEIDLEYDNSENSFYLLQANRRTNIPFDQYLSKVDFEEIQSIWINLKNHQSSDQIIFERLSDINQKLNLKDRVVIHVDNQDSSSQKFKNAGWVVSYRIEDEKIYEQLKNEDIGELEDSSQKIVAFILDNQLSTLSFDIKNYEFVKTYIEPKLNVNIRYLVSDNLNLKSDTFKKDILKSKIFSDPNIEAISVKYKTKFK